MNLSIAIIAVSFLPFFEARNQVANFVIDPPPEGKSVKPALPGLTVTETCPGCDGKGELVLEEPDYGQAKGRLGPAKKTRKKCPLCGGRGKMQSFMNPSELALQVASDRAAFAAEHQGRGEIAVGQTKSTTRSTRRSASSWKPHSAIHAKNATGPGLKPARNAAATVWSNAPTATARAAGP